MLHWIETSFRVFHVELCNNLKLISLLTKPLRSKKLQRIALGEEQGVMDYLGA